MTLLPHKLRLSLLPSKQLLWLWLWWEMRASRGREFGIDAGCGLMQNRRFFDTAYYVGIDVDQDRLDANEIRYPGVRTICAEIEKAPELLERPADVVLCVQVMHNRHFKIGRTIPTISAMYGMLRPGGMLIFNIGARNMPFEEKIDALLQGKFDRIIKRPYGAFSAKETYFSPLLAVLMYLLPSLRLRGGAGKIFYVCHGRK